MAHDGLSTRVRFEPTQSASRPRMVVAMLAGSVAWAGALATVAIVTHKGEAIQYAAALTAGAFVVALVVLSLIRWGRQREERRAARS